MKKKPRRSKRSKLKIIKKKAWKAFSEFIRKRDRNCFTCNARPFSWKELQAGHFIHGKLDFDEMNINAQCIRCNHFLSGNLASYTINLIRKHGMEKVEELRQRASLAIVEKYPYEYFEEIQKKYETLNVNA